MTHRETCTRGGVTHRETCTRGGSDTQRHALGVAVTHRETCTRGGSDTERHALGVVITHRHALKATETCTMDQYGVGLACIGIRPISTIFGGIGISKICYTTGRYSLLAYSCYLRVTSVCRRIHFA